MARPSGALPEYIVCPVCMGTLRPLGLEAPAPTADAEATEDSSFQCEACERRYPVVDGIPVLLELRASKATQPKP